MSGVSENLAQCRTAIDGIDNKIVTLVAERMQIVVDVARIKKEAGMPIDCPGREVEIRERLSVEYPSLPRELIDRIYDAVFDYSKRAQKEAIKHVTA